jgi:hypothetical protein
MAMPPGKVVRDTVKTAWILYQKAMRVGREKGRRDEKSAQLFSRGCDKGA